MKVFLAGGSGVLGLRLIPLLVGSGHEVAAMTRSPEKASTLHALGAVPVVCDVFDLDGVQREVRSFQPDSVMHYVTNLPDEISRIPDFAAENNRVRREGTRNLLAAAEAANVDRFLAQSIAWEIPGGGGAAVADLEDAVLTYGGVVIRYGQLYGSGTYYPDHPPTHPRIRVEEAARITATALHASSGVVTVVEPAG